MINNFYDFWKQYDVAGKTNKQIALETWDACVNNYPSSQVGPEVILEAGEKETQENIKKYILEAEAKGEIVINTGDSLDNYNVDYFIQQPIESILYDLNRDRATILTFINNEKWINDFACMKVIEAMKARLSK